MKQDTPIPPKPQLGETPFNYAMSLLNGKWKLSILFEIGLHPGIRYGCLRRRIPGVTDKVLTQQLRQLEQYGLLTNARIEEGNQVSSSYHLTLIGMDFMPVLMEICRWGKRIGWANMNEEEGWVETETYWAKLDGETNIHWPTEVCRRTI